MLRKTPTPTRPVETTLLVLVAALSLCGVCTQAAASGEFFDHIDPSWIKNPYWFKGEAEVNFYQASIVKYGHPRPTDGIVHILVSEKHKPDLLVKADDWRQPGLVDMLKFNYVIQVPTGIYSYQQMMSVFFNQKDSHVAKMTFASHEWCGNSFKELVNFAGRSSFEYNTYWDGQGNGSFEASFPEHLSLYDALPVQLRMINWEAGLSTRLDLLGSQTSSRAAPPETVEATVEVGSPETVTVPAGDFQAYPVVVKHGKGTDRFWFEADFPNRMLRWETHDHHHYALRSTKMLAYWKLNRPGDESYTR